MYPCPSCVGVLPGMAARARGCPTVGALNPMSWLHCTAILYPTSVSEIMFFFVKSAPKVYRTEFKQNYPPPRLTTTTKKLPRLSSGISHQVPSSMTCGQRFSSVESPQTSLVKETPDCFNTYGFLLYVPIKILEVLSL